MNTDQLAIIMVFGVPLAAIAMRWHLKAREMRVREKQLQMQEKQLLMDQQLRQDEMNAKILQMDGYGASPAEINQLAEEVRQLREEVARIRQDVNGRITH